MEPRHVAVIGLHLLVALLFVGVAVRNALLGNVAGAVMQGVLGVLVVILGVGIARAV
ncbi:MAG: hypothetical protein ACI8UR_001023 [Natronomonas sp.]|uniref:hypothetical protein n=1 Tax=Natronomonas sp. TaxID=2184060 RepID=UPI003988C5C5